MLPDAGVCELVCRAEKRICDKEEKLFCIGTFTYNQSNPMIPCISTEELLLIYPSCTGITVRRELSDEKLGRWGARERQRGPEFGTDCPEV